MKGFETGIYLRTKGGTIEEYGCSIPEDANNKFSVAIEEVQQAIWMAKQSGQLPDDPMLHDALSLINEFLNSFKTFFLILGPSSPDWLD